MRECKIYDYLMEDEYIKEIGANARLAYGIYVDMLKNDINVKLDKWGYKYLINARKYLMQELKICVNTATKINRELVNAELIEEEWQGMNLPLKTYVRHYETVELENTEESYFLAPGIMYKETGFSDIDIRESQNIINGCFNEFPFFKVGRIEERVNFSLFHIRDKKMIKYAIAYILTKYDDMDNLKDILRELDQIVLLESLPKAIQMNNNEPRVCNLANVIFEAISRRYKNRHN